MVIETPPPLVMKNVHFFLIPSLSLQAQPRQNQCKCITERGGDLSNSRTFPYNSTFLLSPNFFFPTFLHFASACINFKTGLSHAIKMPDLFFWKIDIKINVKEIFIFYCVRMLCSLLRQARMLCAQTLYLCPHKHTKSDTDDETLMKLNKIFL